MGYYRRLAGTAPAADNAEVINVDPGTLIKSLSIYFNITGGTALTNLKLAVLEGDCSAAFDYSKFLAGFSSAHYNVGVGVDFGTGIIAQGGLDIPVKSNQITLYYAHVASVAQYSLVVVLEPPTK